MSKKNYNIFSSLQEDSRDETFDILKGIAIIFVIMGHSNVGSLRPFIFSFHMPLFFFITGYFLKIRPLKKEIILSLKRLIVPYVFSSVCVFIIVVIRNYSENAWADISYAKDFVIKFLLGFKGGASPDWIDGTIMTFWFVWAMFWARCLVVLFLNKIQSVKVLCILFFFLGLLGVFLGENVFIPYCIPLGLSAASFVYVGYLVKQYKLLEPTNAVKIFPFLGVCWLYSWWQGGIDIALFWFPSGYIFGLLGALGAFLALFKFVKSFYHKDSLFWRIIYFWGRYSLVVYCIHAIDENLNNWRFFVTSLNIPFEYRGVFVLFIRLMITFVIALILLKIRPLREGVFQIRNKL